MSHFNRYGVVLLRDLQKSVHLFCRRQDTLDSTSADQGLPGSVIPEEKAKLLALHSCFHNFINSHRNHNTGVAGQFRYILMLFCNLQCVLELYIRQCKGQELYRTLILCISFSEIMIFLILMTRDRVYFCLLYTSRCV